MGKDIRSQQGRVTITRDEWLQAMAAADVGIPDHAPDAKTAGELVEMSPGMTVQRVNARMRMLITQGRAERVIKRKRDSAGHVRPVVAYRLLKP
jgi:hypothetical protein